MWMEKMQNLCGNGWRSRRADFWVPGSSGISPNLSSTRTGKPSPVLDQCRTPYQPSRLKLKNLSGSRVSEQPWWYDIYQIAKMTESEQSRSVNRTFDAQADLASEFQVKMTPQCSKIHSEEASYRRRKVWNSDNFCWRFVLLCQSYCLSESLFQISMVRMDWVPSQDGLRQILQLLKVRYFFGHNPWDSHAWLVS